MKAVSYSATFQLDGCVGHVVVSAQARQRDSGLLLHALAGGAFWWTWGGGFLSEQQQQPLDSCEYDNERKSVSLQDVGAAQTLKLPGERNCERSAVKPFFIFKSGFQCVSQF